ncbi:DUF1636 domain-containing protein [Sphingomonas sp. LaA6.9]|uniref:DUF1636 domain-containing protein n=1 Tax=Sphingomonas sp. LaA6.9 TaxID=2919914 RepID=UPI001F4F3AE5|nr:DUF1636 domain-containing protein [Sphingomonas sp. LaA6.9]MCJ8159659.1 DUF1636 domain-containing protein [Sphingomonas sp. LaA6.9]
MLKPVSQGPAIVVCNACRHSAEMWEDADGRTGGEAMVAALKSVATSDPRYAGIVIEEMACLFACNHFCTLHIRAPDKIGYVLGRFTPDAEAARAVLDYALHHAESAEGEVAYALWPEGVKGHFIVRLPPAGFVAV